MVYAADTNVLVRLLVADDPRQLQATLARLTKIHAHEGTVLLGAVSLAELSWVLKTGYDKSRTEIATAISKLLETPPFVAPERDAIVAAVERYRRGPGDFADYLILELSKAAGGTKLLTFDRKLLKHADCEQP